VLSLGPITFAAPLALTGLLALAVIWWFLRLKPPIPVRVAFPAVRILAGLQQNQESPALTPPWLLILRLLLAALVILAASHPLLDARTPLHNQGPIYVIIDDDWAAASRWPSRRNYLLGLADQAEREGRSMVVVTTAPSPPGSAEGGVDMIAPSKARSMFESLQPKAWPSDRSGAVKRLLASKSINDERPGDVIWLSNGLAQDDTLSALVDDLRRIGAVSVITDPAGVLPIVLRAPEYDKGILTLNAERASSVGAFGITVRAFDEDGQVLVRQPLLFKDNDLAASTDLKLPAELYNRLSRLEVEGSKTVAGVVLLDERWRRRPVGIVSSAGTSTAQPLLGETHYLERALEPFTEIRKGAVSELMKRPLAVLVLADPVQMDGPDVQEINDWLEKGGVVLRFAGPNLAQNTTGGDLELLPVELRGGDRVIGGAMSWGKPARLSAFPEISPFFGLSVPTEVTVRRQVLARPSLDLNDKTWARLSDGTPLVTATREGEGWLILVHTTANLAWSDLPISGLFVDMLRRIIDLSQGVSANNDGMPLAPLNLLDAFAGMSGATGAAKAISPADFAEAKVTPEHPPGFYGNQSTRQALNLSTRIASPAEIEGLPEGVERRVYEQGKERDLKPWLLAGALLLFIIDTAISLALRGLLPIGRTITGVIVVFVIGMSAGNLKAQETFARDNSLETRLAYVLTGDEQVDEISRLGLGGLTTVLRRRTAAELGDPQGVDPAVDELSFFPLLYWPIPPEYTGADSLAASRINSYLRNGGTVLIDTRDQSGGGGSNRSSLRALARDIGLPALVPVANDHVLTRSFYLLNSFPGRWTGGTLWIEKAGERVNDGVSPVIVGGHDWAGAWAIDESGRPVFPVVPGGERQRELAYRFGVNLVMYTLTGNYKADQVHMPAIIQRLGQ